jgi:small subunit ribosomal protein S1
MTAIPKTEATAEKNAPTTSHSLKQMLSDYSPEQPKRGQLLEGVILHMDEGSILLDVGAKRDAIVPRRELERLSDEQLQDLDVGDQVPVFVLRTSAITESLLVSLEKGREKLDWDHAEEMLSKDEALELEVVDQNRGGLLVNFGRLHGFVPNSHIPGLREKTYNGEDLLSLKKGLIGTKMILKPIEVNRKTRRFILSGKNARREARLSVMRELDIGQIVKGRVVNIVDFGAFMDLGGVDGLIHISELAWKRVEHASDIVSLGDELEVMVKSVDIERERIGLSRKALLEGPWETIYDRYQIGSLVEGTISNICHFGIFVRFSEGIEGLVHKSELDIIGPGVPQNMFKLGDPALVRIISIDPTKKQMSLSMKQVTYDEEVAWMEQKEESISTDEKS